MAIRRLENGAKIMEGKLTVDVEKKVEDESKSGSKVTFEILKEIAEEVDPMMKFTIDTPCNHKDNKIPVLDLKIQVNAKNGQMYTYCPKD